jgi:hypothetical protein
MHGDGGGDTVIRGKTREIYTSTILVALCVQTSALSKCPRLPGRKCHGSTPAGRQLRSGALSAGPGWMHERSQSGQTWAALAHRNCLGRRPIAGGGLGTPPQRLIGSLGWRRGLACGEQVWGAEELRCEVGHGLPSLPILKSWWEASSVSTRHSLLT